MSMGAGKKEVSLMREKVLLKDVVAWLRAAMEAANRDPGDAGGDYTALSYRELRVGINTETGGLSIYVHTRNREFTGYGEKTYYAITHDGVEVEWREEDIGIVSGSDWLPRGFVEWMKGGGS
jgi:hypothetical protein